MAFFSFQREQGSRVQNNVNTFGNRFSEQVRKMNEPIFNRQNPPMLNAALEQQRNAKMSQGSNRNQMPINPQSIRNMQTANSQQSQISMPQMGGQNQMQMPQMGQQNQISMPQMGGQSQISMPQMGGQSQISMPQMGQQNQISMPQMGGQNQMPMPQMNGQSPVQMPQNGLQQSVPNNNEQQASSREPFKSSVDPSVTFTPITSTEDLINIYKNEKKVTEFANGSLQAGSIEEKQGLYKEYIQNERNGIKFYKTLLEKTKKDEYKKRINSILKACEKGYSELCTLYNTAYREEFHGQDEKILDNYKLRDCIKLGLFEETENISRYNDLLDKNLLPNEKEFVNKLIRNKIYIVSSFSCMLFDE